MKRKYLIADNSILKPRKRKALRDALLPLMGQDASSDLILCASGSKSTLRTSFISQQRYKELKKSSSNAEE